MIDITMSDDYRAFLEEQNYNFTDFQTATLVWNDPMKSRRQKLEALALLRDTTKDIVLKKQIIERIEYENKLSKEEADIVNPFRPERFEGAFFEIPFCYKSAGTPVKDIVDGTYGILSFGEDDWNDYLQEIKDRKWEVDYSDIQAVVLYPIKSEYWDHMHCNPLHLQMELPPHMENKEEDAAYRRAMEALSDYCFYKGERNTEETAKRCMKEYAKT